MNAEKLGLSEKQKGNMEEIRNKYTKEIIRQDAELRIAEMDMEGLLKKDDINLSKVKDALKKAEGIETQIRYLRIGAFVEARKILTEEQKGKLKELMEKTPAMMGEMMKGMMKCEMMEGMGRMMGGGMMGQEMMGRESQEKGPMTKEKSEGGVTATVSLEGKNGVLSFKIVLNSHTVNFDEYKFDEIIILRTDGKEYKGRIKSQEGSGHHRSAVVEFDNPRTKEVEVVIKDVAGVKERIFKFQL
jgi:Spy/CpxP family protein refolding chaperone